ncbi:MAG TPA: hypothetical protein PKH39_04265 [Woeseiaceae bacterium]|nr:hypothetical protein [Woeseiaceae bacterium]
MIPGSLLFISMLAASGGDVIHAQQEVAGATLTIEIRQPVDDEKAEKLIEWLCDTARLVNQAYGRFPNPAPRIVVIPSARNSRDGDKAVIFGRVTRRGQETVELFINADRPIDEFYSDWTATHEFSHLMLPLLSQRYRWISEGFASYYQNILMSRSGRYTPELAWQHIGDGFGRGEASRPELTLNEAATSGIRDARMKIYWSGAAIALLADIQLRQRSEGRQSLDSVLGQLQQCCLPSSRRWSGVRLFEKLDSFLDEPVFMPLYRQFADTRGFPDMQPVLQSLGIRLGSIEAALDNQQPLSSIRRAIDHSIE